MGDSFGVIVIPVVDAYPWVLLIFIGVFVTVNVAILNVILSVIVGILMLIVSVDDLIGHWTWIRATMLRLAFQYVRWTMALEPASVEVSQSSWSPRCA